MLAQNTGVAHLLLPTAVIGSPRLLTPREGTTSITYSIEMASLLARSSSAVCVMDGPSFEGLNVRLNESVSCCESDWNCC